AVDTPRCVCDRSIVFGGIGVSGTTYGAAVRHPIRASITLTHPPRQTLLDRATCFRIRPLNLNPSTVPSSYLASESHFFLNRIQLLGDQLIQHHRIRLPLRQPHYIPDKKRGYRPLTPAILLHLLRIGGNHLVDHPLNRVRIR